jgi:indole-3-glycerol phosphate synthase
MNILEEIVFHKRKEVASSKADRPTNILERTEQFSSGTISLKKFVLNPVKTGIIAEFKRKSPSKGVINENASVEMTTAGYVNAGASALSVLTDENFFGGKNDDLTAARKVNACPILRKDFTIDEYQIVEAKSIGADAILLIAAILKPTEVKALSNFAWSLNLEVLLEVHDEHELKSNLDSGIDLIGVNNRNLKTFEVSIDTSKKLSELIPNEVVKVSESGISSVESIIELKNFGFQGFLIGENFMKSQNPADEAKRFMSKLRERERTK